MKFAIVRTVLCAWLMAYGITLVLIDQDAYSKAHLVVTVRSLLQNALQTPTSIAFDTLRIGLGKATIGNMNVVAADASWSWHTAILELHFSIWHILKHRSLEVQAKLKNSDVTSTINSDGIAIAPAIKRLFAAGNTGKFITVNHVTIINNKITLAHQSGKFCTSITADLPLIGRYRTSSIWWHRGSGYYNNYHLIDDSQGLYRYDHDQKTTHIIHEAILLPAHPAARIMHGTCSHEKETWRLQACESSPNSDELLHAQANINRHEITGSCTIPLAWIALLSPQKTPDKPLAQHAGVIELQLDGQLSDIVTTGKINLTMKNGSWCDKSLPEVNATITNVHNNPCAYIHFPAWGAIQAQLLMKEHEYTAHISTLQDSIILGPWYAKAGSSLDITLNKQGLYHGSYAIDCAQSDKIIPPFTGTFHGSLTDLAITGSSGIYNFTLGASSNDVPHITQVTFHENNNPLLQLHKVQDLLKGSWDVRLFSLILEQTTGPIMLGEGLCTFEGIISTQMIDGTCKLASGSTIRIPYLYNILEELSMHFSIDCGTKKFFIDNVLLNLHQGTIHISQGQGVLNNHGIDWATIPYVAKNCLVSWRKDVFALISGAGTISYTPQESFIKGFLILEKGHISNNILSPQFPTSTLPSSAEKNNPEKQKNTINLDMHIATRKPIQVKTSFLETQVGTTITIKGAADRPSINGSVILLEGVLLFPYKPLFIRQGNVTLHSSVVEAPLHNVALAYGNVGCETHINLLAENTIKGYRIRMHVQGPLNNPSLTFSSRPHLPPEQIIALLFGGSEDGSIYVAMSTYIMQSIKDLLFGSPDSTSTTLQSLKNLFRPLGSVRFVPSFTDQSSRGGIRGSLAIEVNERLRGIIKQNFDLPQDVMLEVEYDLSDDARIRAIKDERGDLGAEIEASWKF